MLHASHVKCWRGSTSTAQKGIDMGIKWWEKTVEYKFVLMVAKNSLQFIAPLDGDEERAGDAIFSTANKWLLIEFKRTSDCVRDEKKKFNNYQVASNSLSTLDSHHHIIFGFDNEGQLGLSTQTYFSGKRCKDLNELFGSGSDFENFSSYIEKFTAFKKTTKSGSGGISVDSYSLVAGVNVNNEIVECLSLAEFQRELGLELELKQDRAHTREYGGHEM